MTARRRILLSSGALALAATTGVLTALPAGAAGFVPPKPTPSPTPAPGTPKGCSTDIIGRGAGDFAKGTLTFSYTVNGPSCRDGLYALIIRNTYNLKQVALFVRTGDGKSDQVVFKQRLPYAPTGNPDPDALPVEGPGLCVIGVTARHGKIQDIAPDPADAPCEPLRGGGARAFH